MISAVYDACVLYSASLRDFLLSLVAPELVFPFWSEEIREEWIRSLLRNRPDLKRENLERTRREMDAHFPRSLVRGYESIIPMLTLPDPDDRHVLAAAIKAGAKYIVTFNLKHYPKTTLQAYGMGRNRRLSKDYEKMTSSSEATVQLANISLMLRRLAPRDTTQIFHYRDKSAKA